MKVKELIEQVTKDTVTEAVKEFAAQSKEYKTALFSDITGENAAHRAPGAKQKMWDFVKALVDNDAAKLKDLSEGTDANGGYLVPTEVRTALLEKLYAKPSLRQYATVIPMGSDRLEMPAEDTTVTVSWTTELAVITQSDPTFTTVTLTANMLAGISRMSRQLLADATVRPSILDWIIGRFADAIRRAENTAFMVGSGSGQPKGIRTYTIPAGNTVAQAGATLAADDLINLFFALPEQYRESENAVFIARDDRIKLVRKLKTTNGDYIWRLDSGSGNLTQGRPQSLLDKPLITSNDIPGNLGAGTNESEIWFVDMSNYIVGDREEISSETSTQEGTSFERHRVALKVWTREDGALAITEAAAKLTAVK